MAFIIPAFLAGILIGTFTGVFPGIHINLITVALIALVPLFPSVPILAIIIFIVSMAITHSFLDFIPSVYFGAPDEDNFLSILPGHQLLNKGKAHHAVVLTLYGSLMALPVILIFTPVFIFLLPYLFTATKAILPFILIFISFYLIFREQRIIQSLIIFLLAGIVGYCALNLEIRQPFLPLLTGLFGLSALFVSLKNKTKIPQQIISPIRKISIPKTKLIKSSLAASLSAPLCSFLPGIGSGHAAIIGSEIFEQDNKSFLFMLGIINTIVIALSFIALYSIGKTRTGSAAAIKEIVLTLSLSHLLIIISTIILTGLFAFVIGINLSKITAKTINKINYKTLSLAVILMLIILNLLLTNFLGILVLITSTSLGIITILSKSRRINLMGSLLLPVIIFYLAT